MTQTTSTIKLLTKRQALIESMKMWIYLYENQGAWKLDARRELGLLYSCACCEYVVQRAAYCRLCPVWWTAAHSCVSRGYNGERKTNRAMILSDILAAIRRYNRRVKQPIEIPEAYKDFTYKPTPTKKKA